jgi:hypothetical protein
MTMRFRPRLIHVGFFLLLAVGLAALGRHYASGSNATGVAPVNASGTEKEDVDPRFLLPALSPQDRLMQAADRTIATGPACNGAYDEVIDAMTEHPAVERIFVARYQSWLDTAGSDRAIPGLLAFRRYYRFALTQSVARIQFPAWEEGLKKMHNKNLEVLFLDNPDLCRLVDTEVRDAIQGRR